VWESIFYLKQEKSLGAVLKTAVQVVRNQVTFLLHMPDKLHYLPFASHPSSLSPFVVEFPNGISPLSPMQNDELKN
jgi:hypothetical protein